MSEENRHHMHSSSSDRLSSLVWALILIWAGAVFLADNVGIIDNLALPGQRFPFNFVQPGAWTLVFLGAGVIVLIEILVRLVMPAYPAHTITGSLVFAAVMFGIALGNMFGWDIIWPMVLIAIGLSVLLGGFLRNRSL